MKSANSDQAFEYIRKRILNGEYPPGKPLVADTLSSEIGVSRTPVRDALRQLEMWGLVSIITHRGAFVKSMDMEEFAGVCGMRLALEGYAAGQAAKNRTDEALHSIKFTLDTMRKIVQSVSDGTPTETYVDDMIREDVRFHVAIMTAARNEVLKKEILKLHLINRVILGEPNNSPFSLVAQEQQFARYRAVDQSHEDIFRAIERRDTRGARDAMESHIQEIIDTSMHNFSANDGVLARRTLSADEMMYHGKV